MLHAQALHVGTKIEKPVSTYAVGQHQPRLYNVEDLTDEDLRTNVEVETGYNRTEWHEWINSFETFASEAVEGTAEIISNGIHPFERRENLCIRGKIAPELFVIGVQKSATTTLDLEIRQSPSVVRSEKELHFFDNEDVYTSKGGKEAFLQNFPDCQQDLRVAAMDATPLYLYKTDFAPGAIKEMYGVKASQLKFVVILREPVERMQSAYYHGRRDGWAPWYSQITFQQLSDYVLSDTYKGKVWATPFEKSKYAPQIKAWFQHFDPSQFIIVPMLYITEPKAVNVTQMLHEQLWNDLGLRWPHTQKVHKILSHKTNAGDHPSLRDDLPLETFNQLQKVLESDASPKQLAELFYNSGARLFGCETCDQEQVEAWLDNSWSSISSKR